MIYLQRAIKVAEEGVRTEKGGPFGALVVKEGHIVAEGCNRVSSSKDPTAHAEIVAIRAACKILNTFQLEDCDIYCSCEPCPMCLGAIYWARPRSVYFVATKLDAAKAGFDDQFIYDEIEKASNKRNIPFKHIELASANFPFDLWSKKIDKILY